MSGYVYLRPIGLMARMRARAMWGGLPLGEGWLDYSAVEVTERRGKAVHRRAIGLGELMETDWGGLTRPLATLHETIRAPRGPLLGLSLDRPRIMGIVNVTPDSFADGGRHATTHAAIDHALRLAEEGADILDIGGESTRPGAAPVPECEELRRVLPVIERLAECNVARLSIDTRSARVMREAAATGAQIINDVSALTHDPEAMATVATMRLPIVLMHAQGDPRTMQQAPTYEHCLLDVFDWLAHRIAACEAAGISRSRLVADPGIGFGKTLDHNLELLAGLSMLHGLGVPILLGASRKSFIGRLSAGAPASARLPGSLAAALAGVAQGAHILRVHDVAETRQALAVWQASTQGPA